MEAELQRPEVRKLPEHYHTHVTDSEETGIRLFGLTDERTDVTTYFAEFNSDFDVHATVAWAGARTSRSQDDYTDIFREIKQASDESKYSAGEKLGQVFSGYGHASVGDMAPVMVFMNKIPIHEAFNIFNHTSVGGGQELSTRYVELKDLHLTPLSDRLHLDKDTVFAQETDQLWQEMQDFLIERYQFWYDSLSETLQTFLEENTEPGTKISKSTVDARVRDVARMFIPAGASTSMTLQTSARNMIDIAGQLRHGQDERSRMLGDQIVTMLELKQFEGFDDLQAELGDLTKSKYHEEGSEIVKSNLDRVRDITETTWFNPDGESNPELVDSSVEKIEFESPGRAVLFQYLAVAYPEVKDATIKRFIEDMDDDLLSEYGEAIFSGHTHHKLMRNVGDIRGQMYSVETALAYMRDFNRHRALGRLSIFLEADEAGSLIDQGFNRNYQIENATYWQQFRDLWQADGQEVQRRLVELDEMLMGAQQQGEIDYVNSHVLRDIIPLGQQTKMYLSGPPTQFSYMTSLRIGLGGDYGYRDLTWSILEDIRSSDAVLKHMASHLEKPDVNDPVQLMGRS